MNITKLIRDRNVWKILLFYSILLTGTYLARKLPNVLQLFLEQITSIPFTFNYNHGIVALVTALLFYTFSRKKQQITLFGNKAVKSLLFPLALFVCYTFYGIDNNHGINPHLWALLFCILAFIYNIMEEYAWRGYLIEALGKANYVVKSIISGTLWCFWHLLVFTDFDQYGGFWMFFVFCIVFSFILTFAVLRTKSIIVAAAIHAFIIQINIAALICFAVFIILLLTWNQKSSQKEEENE